LTEKKNKFNLKKDRKVLSQYVESIFFVEQPIQDETVACNSEQQQQLYEIMQEQKGKSICFATFAL
jgi:hypothetical protein